VAKVVMTTNNDGHSNDGHKKMKHVDDSHRVDNDGPAMSMLWLSLLWPTLFVAVIVEPQITEGIIEFSHICKKQKGSQL